jgi:hypothetical protein
LQQLKPAAFPLIVSLVAILRESNDGTRSEPYTRLWTGWGARLPVFPPDEKRWYLGGLHYTAVTAVEEADGGILFFSSFP